MSGGKPSSAEHAELLKTYQAQKGVLAQEISHYQAELEMSADQIRQMADESSRVKEKIAEYEEECAQQDNRTAYAVSLYSKISNINWDYSHPPGILAGTICHDNTSETNKFHLDVQSMSQFQVANYLWSNIGESY